MPYATQQDLVDRYGEDMLVALTNSGEPPDEIDVAAVTRALAGADATIDGYLKDRYRLPLAVTPTLIGELAVQIAIYKLHKTSAADKIAQDNTDAIKMLAQIANGTVRLDVAGVEPTASGSSGVRTNAGSPRYDASDFKGFT